MNDGFLPVSRKEMNERGWDQVDFVYISGDAYVDHPSFGHAIITRLLESRGYRVGIIAQPDWKSPDSVTVFGEPRLGFLVSAGNMDSLWSTIILYPKSDGRQMLTHPEVLWVSGRIMPALSTGI